MLKNADHNLKVKVFNCIYFSTESTVIAELSAITEDGENQ